MWTSDDLSDSWLNTPDPTVRPAEDDHGDPSAAATVDDLLADFDVEQPPVHGQSPHHPPDSLPFHPTTDPTIPHSCTTTTHIPYTCSPTTPAPPRCSSTVTPYLLTTTPISVSYTHLTLPTNREV